MLFGSDRDQLRKMWLDAWQNHKDGKPLIPLHQELVNIIQLHPEYINFLETGESALGKEYLPETGETNPFLHMAMHQGLHEQLSSNRPAGIREIHQQLATALGDPHKAEHRMIDCLAETLWEAQRHGQPPNEQQYLSRLNALLK